MARTKIREVQVQDSDFASEVELEERINLHNSNKLHPPLATTANTVLSFDGTDYVWTAAASSSLPVQTNNEGKVLGTDGTDASWVPKVDEGWNDIVAPLSAGIERPLELTPLLADTGNGFWGWHFSCGEINEMIVDFHIPHDIKPNSNIYPHVHWMPMSYSRGTVVWEIEWVSAKGHNQNESLTGTSQTIRLEAQGKGLIGEHMVTECTDAQSFIVPEVDSILRMKVRRLGNDVADTFHGTVVGLFLDIHYQIDKLSTVGRLPDFNTPTGAV